MKIVKNVDDWDKNYKLLEEYYKEHGNIDVPSCYIVGEVRLGAWLKNQRYDYKKNGVYGTKITKEHIELLNKLGMIWEKPEKTEEHQKPKIKYSWKTTYKLLEEYYNENGDIDVPVRYIVEDVDLGEWLNMQRLAYKGIGKDKLVEEQIELLNKLGMKWTIKNSVRWRFYYKLLEKYYNKHGNIDVPLKYEIDGVKLGNWLVSQRNAYHHKGTSSISEKQVELLNKLGMTWELKTNLRWMDTYHLLEEYYNEYGDIDVPYTYEVNGVKLGIWLYKQIRAYKGNGFNITEEQIRLLEKLGISWDGKNQDKWNRNYEVLKKYYEVHGNINVPLRYEVDGVKLGIWLHGQRRSYNGTDHHRTIDEKQIELLNKLGMRWQIRVKKEEVPEEVKEQNEKLAAKAKEEKKKNDEELWLSYYKLLENYYQSFGHSDVPQIYAINSIKLGAWVQKQRRNKDKLTSIQIYLLEKLEFKWDIKTELDWKECIELLNQYHKEHGDILVQRTYEKNGINLGLWLNEQRNLYKKTGVKGINPEVVRELNRLGFDWSKPITKNLNKKITNMEIYNKNLIPRAELVLRDLTYEGINEINSEEDQKQITKEMFNRIWR